MKSGETHSIAINGHEIALEGAEPIWAEIDRFFAPYYPVSTVAARHPEITISASVDGAETREPCVDLHRYVAPSTPEITGQIEQHRRPSGVTVTLDRANRHVTIVAGHPTELNLELRIMLRDQIFLPLERSAGAAMFHASCVQREGRAAFFMGEREAGKTTALLSTLSTGAYDIVASDRIKLWVDPASGELRLVGHPSNTNLHHRTVESDPLTRSLIDELRGRYDHEGKFSISTHRLAALAGCRLVPEASPALVVFPQILRTSDGLSVTALTDRDEVARLIAENAITAESSNERARWLNLVPPVSDEGRGAIIEAAVAAASRCIAYRVHGTHAEVSALLRDPGWEAALAHRAVNNPSAHQELSRNISRV